MLTGGFGPRFLQAAAMDPVQRTGVFPDFAFSVSRPAACPEGEPNDRIKAACNCPAFCDIVAGRKHDLSPAHIKMKENTGMKGEISGRKPSYGFFSQNAYGMGEFLGGGCFVIIN